VDYGDLVLPYMPTVLHGQRVVGSCVCSRLPQVSSPLSFSFSPLTLYSWCGFGFGLIYTGRECSTLRRDTRCRVL
jgi:hypothetical protein